MRLKINWKLFIAFHHLYKNKKTDAQISKDPYVVKYLISPGHLKLKFGNSKVLEAKNSYRKFFEKYFLDDFNRYSSFFKENFIPCTGIQNYEEEEIEILIELKNQLDNGDLDEIIKQIEAQGGESLHGVSLMFMVYPISWTKQLISISVLHFV